MQDNQMIAELKAELAILKTLQEWKPGDEGWFWLVPDDNMSCMLIARMSIPENVFYWTGDFLHAGYATMEKLKNRGYRFYRAILPEVKPNE